MNQPIEPLSRQLFQARIIRREPKRYYKTVGLPYSELVVEVEGLGRAVLKYNKSFHTLSLVPGDQIEFSATRSEQISGGLTILIRPTKIRKI